MAKLNWQKVKDQNSQRKNRNLSKDDNVRRADYAIFSKSGLWTLSGKHYGKPINELPLNYLEWIVDKSKSKTHRQLAENEIRQRFYNLKK
jgi:hypothetical protein